MSRKVSGRVYSDNDAHAMYFVHWTLGQVPRHGAHIDIIIGEWDDRSAVSLEYRIGETGPSVMVIDAHGRDHADPSLTKPLRR